jgi:phage terminase small subunit
VPKPPRGQLLTDRQLRFVREYLVDLNATQAAIRAGYSPKAASAVAYETLENPHVQAAIVAGKAAQLASSELSATRVLEELRRLSHVDSQAFYDANGNLKPPSEWTPEMGACVASFDTVIRNAAAGDGHTDKVHRIRLWDKPRALELLAKHFALLTEVVRVDEDAAKVAALLAGRQRAAAREKP